MRLTNVILMAVGMLVFGAANVLAEDHEHNHSHSQAHEHTKEFGFDYNVQMIHDDHMDEKVTGATKDPEKTTNIVPARLYLWYWGELDRTLEFEVYANAVGTGSKALEVAMAKRKMGMITVGAGKNYANVGGFDQKGANYQQPFKSPYLVYQDQGVSNVAMPGDDLSPPMFEVNGQFGPGGAVTLQLFDDVVGDGSASGVYFANTNKQPAWTLEWFGGFGPASLLVQMHSYDLNKSMAFNVGLGIEAEGFSASLDYGQDTRKARKAAEPDAADTHVLSNLVFGMAYNAGMFKPYFKYADFDWKQPDTDHKGNGVSYDNSGNMMFSMDNATVMAVGVNYTHLGEHFVPSLTYISRSNDQLKDATKVADATETKTSSEIYFGFHGSL